MLATYKVTYRNVKDEIKTHVVLAFSADHAKELCLQQRYGVFEIISVEKKK